LNELETLIGDPEFWNNPEKSQEVMQKRKRLEEVVAQDTRIATLTGDLATLIELGKEGEDVAAMLNGDIAAFRAELAKLETSMLLSGEHDHRSAILNIHPGAGGTESQDWAEMLMRMFLRWAERNGFTATITDEQAGDGAGIKNATIEVEGHNAYGLLQGEIGVHRLVRISPFDANARRHTSFASVFVFPMVDDEIKIEIKPEDVRTDVFRASGAGGQHVNRTESAVRMTHIPTGIVVQCQNERSQHKNRASALKQLKARLFEHELEKRRAEEKKSEDSKMDINFGSQIRSYVLAPYRLIKDHRTKLSIGDVDRVLDGDLGELLHAYLVFKKTGKTAGDSKEDLPD
jgi:peptide chain release factor 2